MLRAIFYARFHPERGPAILHQYPTAPLFGPGSRNNEEDILSFSDVSPYIIPQYEVCNRPLSICIGGSRVLGFPVSLEDPKYARNRFTFNVCFWLDQDAETQVWEAVVRKTAAFFRAMEEEDGLLHAEELLDGLRWAGEERYPAEGVGIVHGLLRSLLEDLNSYGEAYARVSDVHALNLRLTSPLARPAKVNAWDVPLLVRPLPSSDQWTWDLTLQQIAPHVDGIKHVQRIAELADVEVRLVKKALRELLRHNQILLLDIFHFHAIYTTNEDFSWFVQDEAMLDECSAYIAIRPLLPPHMALVSLYRQLGAGVSLQDFCHLHHVDLASIDIRRFITFGVLKGFLRRIHKYPLLVESQPSTPKASLTTKPATSAAVNVGHDRPWKTAARSSGWRIPQLGALPDDTRLSTIAETDPMERLSSLLDGRHCMDEIGVTIHMSEKQVLDMLRNSNYGEVMFICK